MDGEFVCEDTTGLTKAAVGGGNLLIMGRDRLSTLARGRSGGRRDRRRSRRDHAVSRRHRALRLEDRLEIQGARRLDEPGLLPDPEGPRRQRAHAGCRLGAGDRHRRPDGRGRRRGDASRPRGARASAARESGARPRSAPAITAASSGNSSTGSPSCWRERADLHAARSRRRSAATCRRSCRIG